MTRDELIHELDHLREHGVDLAVGLIGGGCTNVDGEGALQFVEDEATFHAEWHEVPRETMVAFMRLMADKFQCLGTTTRGRRCTLPALGMGKMYCPSTYTPVQDDYCGTHQGQARPALRRVK